MLQLALQAALVILAAPPAPHGSASAQPQPPPAASSPSVESAAARIGLTATNIADARAGQIVIIDQPRLFSTDLAVAAIIVVRVPLPALTAFIKSGDALRSDSQTVAMGPVGADDAAFAPVAFHPAADMFDVRALLNARPGTKHNLSQPEIDAFRALKDRVSGTGDAREADAATLASVQLRALLASRLGDYRARGVNALSPYQREGAAQTRPGEILEAMTAREPLLEGDLATVRTMLAAYPGPGSEGLAGTYFWRSSRVEFRPEFALIHQCVHEQPDRAAVIERHVYAFHSYNALQISQVLFAAGDSTLVILSNHTSTDELSGFGGDTRRTIAQARLRNETQASLRQFRDAVQSSAPAPNADQPSRP